MVGYHPGKYGPLSKNEDLDHDLIIEKKIMPGVVKYFQELGYQVKNANQSKDGRGPLYMGRDGFLKPMPDLRLTRNNRHTWVEVKYRTLAALYQAENDFTFGFHGYYHWAYKEFGELQNLPIEYFWIIEHEDAVFWLTLEEAEACRIPPHKNTKGRWGGYFWWKLKTLLKNGFLVNTPMDKLLDGEGTDLSDKEIQNWVDKYERERTTVNPWRTR
jgi:hypothetical protein